MVPLRLLIAPGSADASWRQRCSVADLLDHQLRRLARQRRMQRGVDAVLRPAAVSLGIAAGIAVVVRLAIPAAAPLLPAIVVAGILVPFAWLPAGWRRRDDASLVAGHLDQLTDGRGLAMALAEAQPRPEDWLERLRVPLETFTPPALRWHHGQGALWAALAVVIALLLPQQVTAFRAGVDPVAALFTSTEQELTALENAGALPPEVLAEQRHRLEELREHAEQHGMDQATWEAKDRLEQRLRAEAGSSSRSLAEALAQAEVASTSSSAGQQAASEALAQRLGELAARAPGLVPQVAAGDKAAMREAIAAAAAKGLLTPEQAAALEKLGFSPEGGQPQQMNAQQQRDLAEKLRQELNDRARELGTCEGCEGLALMLEEARGRGQGAPDRGPGHTDHPQLATDRFTVGNLDDLPPGARVNPDGSITLAEQVREPDVTADALQDSVRAAARAFDPAAADASTAEIAPRHRAAVGRYFTEHAPTAPLTKSPAPAPVPAPAKNPPPSPAIIP